MGSVIFVIVVGIGIAGFLAWRSRVRNRQRQTDLASLAAELGLSFANAKDRYLHLRFPQIRTFSQGRKRIASNTMTGSIAVRGAPLRLVMGDYTYTTGRGRNSRTHRISYLLLGLLYPDVPDLRIRDEHVFDRVSAAVGFDDIDFESAEFSRSFYVTGPDKRFAYDIVTPRMMEFLLKNQSWSPPLELAGGLLFVADPETLWDDDDFRDALTYATRFLELWPDHLWHDVEKHKPHRVVN
ncbi:MAG: hypothetical protein AAFR96_09085 [Planctomycetota bacterium]